ncbi:MAG: hypothetical protein AAGG08_14755 [Actinomycetota bacterium]
MVDSNAEQFDPSVLGEGVGDTGRAGDDFPRDAPMGVEDPTIVADGVIARDDVASRSERIADASDDAPARGPGLAETGANPTGGPESDVIVEAMPTPDEGPEAAAVHVTDG